ncbi:DnaJ like chaperone protein [Endobacter medicaginis]|jgi:DnaJ like chaperone protein|uniref:DnaJ like chaperone protein n=2 Tax=Endobacter medicaginis TaxID=1181271 RepID=A0A839UWW8_9PROT|nr:TerB family tellurite resistance protein [Endobacter medicaginis]MBB3173155.1 DnaJ like chaperone protein [Endobacter medicaginis]MCX5476097.1 TerB family tellurite resistance protein [Endobacter medicaginis]
MSIWGKVLGGAAGMVMGGPVGGLLGAALGHAADRNALFDNGTPRMGGGPGFAGPDPGGAAARIAVRIAAVTGRHDQVLAMVTVMLAAKLAKCDGAVNRTEIDAFKTAFRIPAESARDVGRLFDQARHRSDDFEPFARELGRAFADRRSALEDLLAALFAIARADGPVNAREEAFLRRVHVAFGLAPQAWERARSGRASAPASNEPDAYAILGIRAGASNEDIRKVWRQLMQQNHPDRLAASGADPQQLARAAERVGRINAAWDRIKRERGLR